MAQKFYHLDFSFLDRLVETVNAYLTKAHSVIIRTTVVPEAHAYARNKLPTQDEASMEPYIGTFRGRYLSLKKEVGARIKGGIQRVLGAVNVSTANQNIESVRTELTAEKTRHENLLTERSRIHTDHDHQGFLKNRPLLYVLAVGEILWIVSAFLKLGDILIGAVLIGIGVAVGQVVSVKTAALMIKEIVEERKRRARLKLAIILSVVFSFVIAILRYWFVDKLTGGSIPLYVLNPFIFAVINLLLILGTWVVVYFFFPTKEELVQIREIERLDREIKKSVKRQNLLQQELNNLRQQREFLAELRIRTQHAEKMLTERIDGFFTESVGLFKSENSNHRSDGVFPVAFKRGHDPLGSVGFDSLLFT